MINQLKSSLRRLDNKFLGVSIFLVLFFCYGWAPHIKFMDFILKSKGLEWWNNFQSDSDLLVTHRLDSTVSQGWFSHFGAMGPGGTYNSQVGLKAWLDSLPPAILGLETAEGTLFMYASNAFIGAGFIAMCGIFVFNRLKGVGLAIFLVLMLQPWPTAMMHSIYWSFWVKFIPAVLIFVLARATVNPRIKYLLIFFSSVFVFLSGYEFVTLVFFSAISIAIYNLFSIDSISRYDVRYVLINALLMISGFFFAISIHFLQLFLIFNDLGTAFQKILLTVVNRTGATNLATSPILTESLSVSPMTILDIYFGMPILFSPSNVVIFKYVTVFFIVCAVVFMYFSGVEIPNKKNFNPQYRALFVAWVVGLLGPIGWHLLARPHSYIHGHINFALWYFFTVPLGCALIGHLLVTKSKILRKDKNLLLVVRLVSLFLLFFFLFSSLNVR